MENMVTMVNFDRFSESASIFRGYLEGKKFRERQSNSRKRKSLYPRNSYLKNNSQPIFCFAGIKVNVYVPDYQIEQAKYATEITPKILDFYEEFFQLQFPLPKLDLIGIPDFGAGAMENWGLVTYRMTNLLCDPKVPLL